MGDYIASAGVKVFPSALRSGAYSQGKFTTEYNLTSFLRSVTDRKSFSIADPNATPATASNPHYNANYYMFVINGFYFEVGKTYLDDYSSNPLYASIQTDANGRLIAWDGGVILDDTSNCIAIKFTSSIPTGIEGASVYSLNIKAADRFAKFNTDTLYLENASLTDVLENKQNKFTSTNQLHLDTGLVTGVLPVANGGTGQSNLDSVVVGKAKALNNTAAIGSTTKPVYINANGNPEPIVAAEKAVTLTDSAGTSATYGTTSKPIYVNNGVPTAIGNNIDAYALGLQNGCGQKDTTSAVKSCTTVWFDSTGVAQTGFKINVSDSTPGSAVGTVGDLWFKYQA